MELAQRVAERVCPGHEHVEAHSVCQDLAREILGLVGDSEWLAVRLVAVQRPAHDLCDRWDVFTKGEGATARAVREALLQGLLGYDPNVRLEQD